MAMTKAEVLKVIRNHIGDIKTVLIGVDAQVASVAKGVYPEPGDFISELKTSLDAAKDQIDEVKDTLNEWPQS